jgi:hypothetical protein
MTLAVDYKSYVEPIRAELLKLIRARRVTYYGELGQTITKVFALHCPGKPVPQLPIKKKR